MFELLSQTTSTEETAAAMSAFFIVMLMALPLIIFMIVAMWKVFEKAGRPGWAAIVPVYNGWVQAEIAGKEGYWGIVPIALSFIPVVGPLASIAIGIWIALGIARKFGKEDIFAALLLFLPFIGYGILGFGNAAYESATTDADDASPLPTSPPTTPEAPQDRTQQPPTTPTA